MKSFKQFLLTEDIHDYSDIYHEELSSIVSEVMYIFESVGPDENSTARQEWYTIPLYKIKKTWEDSYKYGFVRNEKQLEEIRNLFLSNVAKVHVNTEILGHMDHAPDELVDILEEMDKTIDDFYDHRGCMEFFDDSNGAPRLSDYGLKPLIDIAVRITDSTDPMETLGLIDQGFNIVHQRSDIASWFVEGGTSSLMKISGENY